jgi:predicted RNA polymerase sigma factor
MMHPLFRARSNGHNLRSATTRTCTGRGEAARRLGGADARAAYRHAIVLTRPEPERGFLERRHAAYIVAAFIAGG